MIELTTFTILIRLVISYSIGLLIGLERTISKKPAGVITNSTVCMASSALSMLQITIVNKSIEIQENTSALVSVDLGRIPAQVITGVGFIGAGAIIVSGKKITGLTTAAIVWTSAVIGLIIGSGELYLGLILSGFILFNMLVISRITYKINQDNE